MQYPPHQQLRDRQLDAGMEFVLFLRWSGASEPTRRTNWYTLPPISLRLHAEWELKHQRPDIFSKPASGLPRAEIWDMRHRTRMWRRSLFVSMIAALTCVRNSINKLLEVGLSCLLNEAVAFAYMDCTKAKF